MVTIQDIPSKLNLYRSLAKLRPLTTLIPWANHFKFLHKRPQRSCMVRANIQNDLTTEIDIMDERGDFASFELKGIFGGWMSYVVTAPWCQTRFAVGVIPSRILSTNLTAWGTCITKIRDSFSKGFKGFVNSKAKSYKYVCSFNVEKMTRPCANILHVRSGDMCKIVTWICYDMQN